MTIKQQLEENLKEAMKSQDEDRKRVYRVVLASIRYLEKEQGKPLDDPATVEVLQKEIKIRREMIADALKADRPESIEEKELEINLIETFLPKQLSEDEIKEIVQKTIAEVGAVSPADMGKVMKAVLPQVKGLAPNDQVSRTVRELLQ
ncbi:MAG: GatB/YqeY domain-containing protein [Chloroflexi bacterium]|jgi:uncharacterized protein YqeY|nr:GatB/YqeY domain-containing protein [Chloroflexota bacterium]